MCDYPNYCNETESEARKDCPKCGGEMKRHLDKKTLAHESICENCGYTIIHGFGVL